MTPEETFQLFSQLTENQVRAMQMRLAGASYREIAKALNYETPSSAYKAVQKALRVTRVEPVEELRQLEVERIDRAQLAIWPTIINPDSDPEDRDKALGRFIQLSKRRSELLGMNAPTQVDIRSHVRERAIAEGMDADELIKEVEELMNASMGNRYTPEG